MADASQKLLEELEAIREEAGGILKPEDVVTWAEANPESELYRQFTWDNEKAAHKRRLDEARRVIRFFKFSVPNTAQETRLYISLEPDRQAPGGGYRHLSEVMNDQEKRAILFRQAIKEAERFKARFGALKELAKVFDALDEFVDLVQEMNQDTLVVTAQDHLPKEPATTP